MKLEFGSGPAVLCNASVASRCDVHPFDASQRFRTKTVRKHNLNPKP